jgi:LDH2 family malate/lactate/ureidoglycolate dehydrogenase
VVGADALRGWVAAVFQTLGVEEEDARVTAENLVAADLRGVESHGVARLDRYTGRIVEGLILPRAEPRVVHETPATALVDAGNGLGQPASKWAMDLAMRKARETGHCSVAVRDSNHFGIAAYYAMMAPPHDMIGVTLTNSAPLVVPTGGRMAVIGTNPIAVAFPTLAERPWVLDMATSVVPRGKLEVYARKEQPMPLGWAVDETGRPTEDAQRVLDSLVARAGGGILPLGGTALFGGYKGYHLSALVDILTGVLPGSNRGPQVDAPVDGKPAPSRVGHFFSATRVDGFRPAEEFKRELDEYIRMLRESPKAEGESSIYTAGEMEAELQERHEREGVPLHSKVIASLRKIGEELGPRFDLL